MPAIRFGFRLAKNYYSWSDYLDAGMLSTLFIEREKCPKMSKNVHNIFERKTSIESEIQNLLSFGKSICGVSSWWIKSSLSSNLQHFHFLAIYTTFTFYITFIIFLYSLCRRQVCLLSSELVEGRWTLASSSLHFP